jgi:hypothetical protein
MSDEEVVLAFVKTSEYINNTITPNSVTEPAGGTTFNETNLINTFYQRLFGRLAVASEVAGWSTALAQGTVNHDYLGITILRAGLNLTAGTEMRSVLEAKISSSQAYSENLSANPASASAYSTNDALLLFSQESQPLRQLLQLPLIQLCPRWSLALSLRLWLLQLNLLP